MDIYTKKGTMVQFRHPDAGYNSHQETAKKYLKVMKSYTIESTDISSGHTNVYLKEFPGIGFNSVHFINIPQMPSGYIY